MRATGFPVCAANPSTPPLMFDHINGFFLGWPWLMKPLTRFTSSSRILISLCLSIAEQKTCPKNPLDTLKTRMVSSGHKSSCRYEYLVWFVILITLYETTCIRLFQPVPDLSVRASRHRKVGYHSLRLGLAEVTRDHQNLSVRGVWLCNVKIYVSFVIFVAFGKR
jgi:hypothetical protein